MALKFETNFFDIAKFIGIGLLVAFVFFNYGKLTSWFDRPDPSEQMEPIVKVLEAGLIRITAQNSTARLESLIDKLREDNSIALKSLEKANKKVDEITTIVTKIRDEAKIDSGGEYIDTVDTRTYYDYVVKIKDAKGKDLPVGIVRVHPFIKENKWTWQPFPLDMHTNVLKVESGPHNSISEVTAETYFTNDFVKSSKGKKYYFNSDINWAKREERLKQFMFNLRLGFTGNVSTESVFPGLDLSFASYGRTNRDLDWRFLTLGIGYDNEDVFGYLYPVQYNVGNFIPLIENLYIGPLIGVSTGGTYFGGGISILF